MYETVAIACKSAKTPSMFVKIQSQRFLMAALSLSTLVAFHNPAFAQDFYGNFYGPPAPSDFSMGVGGNETKPQEISRSAASSEQITEGAGGEDVESGGTGLGIFARKPFLITAAVREGFDSNVFTTRTDPTSSFYTNMALGLRYDLGTPRLSLSANLGGGVTYYYSRPGEKFDYNALLGLTASYKVSPRFVLTLSTSTGYLSQPDLTIVGGTNRVDGDYFYTDTILSGRYQWTQKFSTVTSYNIRAFNYFEQSLNNTQGRIEQTASQSFHYLLLPKTTIVAEYRANAVTYYQADLNSFGNFGLLGFDQVFNPRTRWTLRAGVEQRFLHNPVDGDSTYIGPYGESNLSYQFGPASFLSWNARYGTEASGLTDVTQRQTFRTGLSVSHAFTQRINMVVASNWQVNYYEQQDVIPSFTETVLDVSATLGYKLNRFASLTAGYQYTVDIAPDAVEREYNRSIAFAGVNFTF